VARIVMIGATDAFGGRETCAELGYVRRSW
jgi:hypothetical protein